MSFAIFRAARVEWSWPGVKETEGRRKNARDERSGSMSGRRAELRCMGRPGDRMKAKDKAARSAEQGQVPKRKVTQAELLEFYSVIKSADTIGVFNAAKALDGGDVAAARDMLLAAKHQYERKHARVLARSATSNVAPHRTPKEVEKAEARKEKVQQVIKTFEEYLGVLERTVRIRRAVRRRPEDSLLDATRAAGRASALPGVVLQKFQSASGVAEEEAFLRSQFQARPVLSEGDLVSNGLYAALSEGRWRLFQIVGKAPFGDSIPTRDAMSGRRANPISKPALLKAGSKERVLLLQEKDAAKHDTRASSGEIVLDENEFNVLWAVVRDTGILPNAADITLVQKNEFRRAQYDRALKKMLILQRSFDAAARGKRQELDRELRYLEAQKRNLPLREVEKRKSKIAQIKRIVERAESHFLKVVNSLYALESRRASSED